MSREINIVGGCGCLEDNCCVVKATCVEEITPIDCNVHDIDQVNKSIESAHDLLRNMLACCYEDFCKDYNGDKDKFSPSQRNIVRKLVSWMSYKEWVNGYDDGMIKDAKSQSAEAIKCNLERKLKHAEEKIKLYKTAFESIVREFYPDCLPSLAEKKRCGCKVDCGSSKCKNSYTGELSMFDVVVKSKEKYGHRRY